MSTPDYPDYYAVLGVSCEADQSQLRAEYVARAQLLHPDRIQSSPPDEIARANREMALLNEAWEVLSDPERRRAYDASLAARAVSLPPVPRAAHSAGKWLGNLVTEYRRGRHGD